MAVKGYKQQNRKRHKKHGFLSRKKTSNGNKVLQNRRRKGRKKLSPA